MAISSGFEFLIQWHLTERCNLRCTHCYQEGARSSELSTAEVCSCLDEIADMFSAWSDTNGVGIAPSFNITGGEPFLREDFFAILGMIAGRGWPAYVLTNGTLVDMASARRLADLGVGGVQISLEGTEAVHDAFRGKGSFKASLSGIRALLDAGVEVTVNATLSEVNAEDFFALADAAAELSVQRLGFSRLVPSGNGIGLADRMLTPDAVGSLYRKIQSLSYPAMAIVTGDPVAACMREAGDDREDHGDVPVGGCAAGVSGLTILSDGTLVPCRRLPLPLGNVRTDSLRETWVMSPILEALRRRESYEGTCGVCGRWATCRGCRAIAYASSRISGSESVLADDPQCPFDRENVKNLKEAVT